MERSSQQRVWNLLAWHLHRDLKSARTSFVILVIVVVGRAFPWIISGPETFEHIWQGGTPSPGISQFFYVASLVAAVSFSAGGVSGAGKVGPLLLLTGISRTQWTAFQTLSMLIGFLKVWICGLPFLVLWYVCCAVPVDLLMASELMAVGIAMLAGSLMISVGAACKSRGECIAAGFVTLILWQLLMVLPYVAFSLFDFMADSSYALRDPLQQLVKFWNGLNPLGWYRDLPLTLADWWSHWPGLLLHFGLCGLLLVLGWTTALTDLNAEGEPTGESSGRKRQQRFSRRVWDDALAWQAYQRAGGDTALSVWRMTAVVVISAMLWAWWTGATFFYVLTVSAGVIFAARLNYRPGSCLKSEIQNKTLPSLSLLPFDDMDFYRGWRRASRRFWLADSLVVVLAVALILSSHGMGSYYLFMVIPCLLSGPACYYSAMTQNSPDDFFEILTLGFGFALILGSAAMVSSLSQTGWTGAALLPLLMTCYNRILLMVIHRRFQEAIARES